MLSVLLLLLLLEMLHSLLPLRKTVLILLLLVLLVLVLQMVLPSGIVHLRLPTAVHHRAAPIPPIGVERHQILRRLGQRLALRGVSGARGVVQGIVVRPVHGGAGVVDGPLGGGDRFVGVVHVGEEGLEGVALRRREQRGLHRPRHYGGDRAAGVGAGRSARTYGRTGAGCWRRRV